MRRIDKILSSAKLAMALPAVILTACVAGVTRICGKGGRDAKQ